MSALPEYMSMEHMFVPRANGGPKGVLVTLELEVQVIVSCHVCSGNQPTTRATSALNCEMLLQNTLLQFLLS